MKTLMNYWESTVKFCTAHPFLIGCAAGAAAMLAFFLFTGMILWNRRAKHVKEISYAGRHGMIHIRIEAIRQLILSLQKEFSDISILHVSLCRKQRNLLLHVQVQFLEQGKSFPVFSESFQNRAISALKEVFGIDTVKKVEISVLSRKNS